MLGFRPLNSGPLSEILEAQITQTTTTTVRFATRTFVTRSADAPANEVISGRIASGLRVDRRLETVAEGQFGSLVNTEYGEVQLKNNDGSLDSLATRFEADGRQVRLRIGATETSSSGSERVQPYSQFATVYVSTAGTWTFEHDVLRLPIESLNNRIQDRLQNEAYSGLGGIEGTAEIAGRSKPTLFGRGSNVSPQLLDPAILTYQIHAGNIELISAVYDGGAGGAHDAPSNPDFTFAGDFPTYGTLAAASVPAGAYATSLAVGCLRLGIAPIFGVTVDARGHKDNITGNYIETTADVIRTILRDYVGINTNLIDHTAFNALNGLQSGDIGLFLPAGDQSTVADVIRRLAFGAGAIISDKSGFFSIQRFDPPGSVVHWAFNDRDIISIQRLTLPYVIPWKAWGVGYDVNWTVQTNSDLAGGVTQARRAYLQSERRFAYAQDVDIALFHATSHGAPLRESFFSDSASAQAEAQRLIGLYSYGRTFYEVVVKNALLSVHIGQTVRLTYHRWDLDGGKNFVVVGVADDADRVETALTVFG